MKLSVQFQDLILKQLESFGCFMGIKHLIVYFASAKEDSKAGFELISQWPQLERSLLPVDDDPELKVSSPNRRWYPIQDKKFLIGVLRVETDSENEEWPLILDSRLKALSNSLAKSFAIEIERQRKDEEINNLRSQVSVVIHQLRNPLAALTTYAKLLIKRFGEDDDAREIVERMLTEQNQINNYINSFEQINNNINFPIELSEERLLLPPNLDKSKRVTIKSLLEPILDRGKANAKLQKRIWTQTNDWPDWTLENISLKYIVISEIIANLLENAFKYTEKNAEVGLVIIDSGFLIFDNGKKISKLEQGKIFEKGVRGIASKNKKGSGVGLYLARKLARQIGGELYLCDQDGNNKINSFIRELQKTNIFYLELPIEKLNK